MTELLRGRIYRARLDGAKADKFYLVVSNNGRNRSLESALVVRFTTSPKLARQSIVEIPASETLGGGRVVCDDIEVLYADEVKADAGALSSGTMQAVDRGLKAALGLR